MDFNISHNYKECLKYMNNIQNQVMIQHNNKRKPYKVIIVGFQAVGKTSLLHRIIQSNFKADYETTIGVDFKIVKIPISNKQVALQIWDTAGQEKFSALTKSYFQGSHACIAVFDLQDKHSLRKAEQYVKIALDEYHINPECVFLIGNKSDESRQLEEQGREFGNNQQINFAISSAKSGQGVHSILSNLAVKLDATIGQFAVQKQKGPKIQIKQEKSGNCAC